MIDPLLDLTSRRDVFETESRDWAAEAARVVADADARRQFQTDYTDADMSADYARAQVFATLAQARAVAELHDKMDWVIDHMEGGRYA